MSVTTLPLDYAAIKQRQQVVWSAGDYAIIGTTLQIVGERLCEAIDMRAGDRVLDVAAGNGNATLAAARRFALAVQWHPEWQVMSNPFSRALFAAFGRDAAARAQSR